MRNRKPQKKPINSSLSLNLWRPQKLTKISLQKEIQGITFEGNNDKDKTREFDLYKNDIELRRELVNINRKLNDKANIIDSISSKQESGYVDNTRHLLGLNLKSKHYYLVLFTFLTFIVLMGIEFLKFLEQYKPED